MGPVELLLIAVIVLGVSTACYGWGASIAERKGYSRSMGWWAFAFSLPGLAALYLMPESSRRDKRLTARPVSSPSPASTPAPRAARFCIECGTANTSGGRFCTECGAGLALSP